MKNIQEITLTRRAHLQSLLAAAVAAAIPVPVPAAGPGGPPDLMHLDNARAKTLLSVTRTLFPHDMLDDRFYWPVVASLDAAMADGTSRESISDGLVALDAGFAGLDQADREAALAKLEDSPFFALVYTETINGLYTNRELWKLFGYGGSSVEHGGYINRGFDKIDWLPNDEEGAQ